MWYGVASRWGVRGRSEHRKMMGWMFHFWIDYATQRKMVGFDKKGVFIKDHLTREITMCEAACLSIWFG